MNDSSKIFDKIRVSSRKASRKKAEHPMCDWEDCEEPGTHKAPKGKKSQESESGIAKTTAPFHQFCMKHVRKYNQTFNFFADEKPEAIGDIVRQAAKTGERPTWSMGANARGRGGPKPRAGRQSTIKGPKFGDPLNLFARLAHNQGRTPTQERERRIHESDRVALETLGLTGGRPKTEDIKKAYKELVKIHHPDANGGDRASEDRLRTIITAYTHLKKKGFL